MIKKTRKKIRRTTRTVHYNTMGLNIACRGDAATTLSDYITMTQVPLGVSCVPCLRYLLRLNMRELATSRINVEALSSALLDMQQDCIKERKRADVTAAALADTKTDAAAKGGRRG